MFLKRLQAVGFKSFADKVSIPFDRGITGIVGPNGSGKSNVIDAVRWVMGEQNAKNLRGKVATDIIFSGAAHRKPMAMAEVTLTFDNSESSPFCPSEYRHEPEISLTRRLYADGEREYLINKKPCRLRDILDFFSSTGLGGRSYSMIQQGQVDRILTAKPEDVRIIIEEAAGTLVFRNRREDALKKLAQTRDNLSRIEDIVQELERQQSSLKSQMEKAKSWREMSTQLQSTEMQLFINNFKFYSDQLAGIADELSGALTQEASFLALISQDEATQAEIQRQIDAADPGLETLRESVSIAREQIARAESIISSTEQKIADQRQRFSAVEKEIEADQENLQVFEKQFANAESEVQLASERASLLREEIESFQAQVEEVEEKARVYQDRIDDFADELRGIERTLENNSIRCEAINRERDKIASEIQVNEERRAQLDAEITSFKKQLDKDQAAAQAAQGDIGADFSSKERLQNAIRLGREKIEDLTVQRDQSKEKYFDTRARLSTLQQLMQSGTDAAAAREKLQAVSGDSAPIKRGFVADYIKLSEDAGGLSVHVKSALARWAERFIVRDSEELNDLVQIAKRSEAFGGFAVSMHNPESIHQESIHKWAKSADVMPLTELVQLDANADPLIAGLIARVFISSALQLTSAEITKIPAGAIVFAGMGLCIYSSGEFFVSAKEGDGGLLTRKAEAEKLTEEIKGQESGLASLQIDIDSTQARLKSDEKSLAEIESALQEQDRGVVEALAALKGQRQMITHKEELRASAGQQEEQLRSFDKKLIQELATLGENRIAFGEEQVRIRNEMEDLEGEAQDIREQRDEVFRQNDGRKLELAKCEARAQSLSQGFESVRAQFDRLSTALNRRYAEKSRIESEIEAIRENHQRSESEIQILLVRREQLESELQEKREANQEFVDRLRAVESSLKTNRDAYNKLEKANSGKKLEAERLKLAMESISQQALEKYRIDLSSAELTVDLEFDEKKAAREISKLRSKIEELGAINMMAIEEYDTLMTRLDFIRAQREEVLNSINLLEDALEEIEETTKIRFVETFTKVNAEFQALFPILFPSGEGRLDLTTPEDPLNAGVEIMARLPGKKAQRMTLLSGGEKALTAISLIFALLKTKPTPFCFLDEVDAPLDEANVGRYNRVLEALADRFQFIVITHNRRTMEVLDILFGVTMQEPGVSKVVGVDMKKDIPEHLKKAFKEDSRAGASVAG